MDTGAEVAQSFFADAVRPVVERHWSGVGYLAARLGSGSDVIGFDDHVSADHDFGCRLTLLVDTDAAHLVDEIDLALEAELPVAVGEHPVRFSTTWDPRVRHKVDVHTVHDFAQSRLGFDTTGPLATSEWLCLTGQSILEVIGGPVFHDTTAAYGPLSTALAWYPDGIWFYVLAAGWRRLAQELPFVGRSGDRGDDTGSRVIAARLARDIMHLGFLLERRWPPYSKWLGTGMTELGIGNELGTRLDQVFAASDWQQRQTALGAAIEALATQQAELGLPCPSPIIQPFFDRDYTIIDMTVTTALLEQTPNPEIKKLPLIGSIEQWSDNADLLSNPGRRAQAAVIYARTAGPA